MSIQISGSGSITGVNDIQTVPASGMSYTPAGAGAVPTTVQAKLRKLEISDSDFPTLQQAIDALVPGQRLNISSDYTLSTGLTITNKSRIRITGKGKISLSGASSSAFIFKLVGTIDDLEIDSLTLVGENNSAYSQTAIGCNSGQTVSNARFHDLNISQINVGISLNADLGGSYTKSKVYNNTLTSLIGVNPGQGYGIHLANATDCQVYSNVIDGAQRHSLYQAKGAYCNNIYSNNIIRNHRSGVASALYRPAFSCQRSSNVTIANNKFIDGYDGSLEIAHDSSGGFDCSNILVIGNSFVRRKNVVADIAIGEQAVPTANDTFKVDLIGNTFDEDVVLSSGGVNIVVFNGRLITIKDNRFRKYNVTSSLGECIELAHPSFTTADNHAKDITVLNNDATSDAAVANSRAIYVGNQLCVGSSPYTVKNTYVNGYASELYFATNPTNLNSKLKFTAQVTVDFPSVPAQNFFTGAYAVTGCKPTSVVTGRPRYSVSNGMSFSAMAHDVSINTVGVFVTNPGPAAQDWPSQTIIFSVEDF